jgi:Zn-dependent peptidase ImmA (M78 family)
VRKLRTDFLNDGIKYPLDIFSVCNSYDNLKIAAIPFKTKGLRGMANISDNEDTPHCILVNSHLSLEEQNFHGFHELMHVYFEKDSKGSTFNCYDKVQPFQDSYTEWLANEGAAELMLPHDVLLPCIKEYVKTFDNAYTGVFDMIQDIAHTYKVSPIVVDNRLNSLSYEIFQYLNGCDLENINIISKNQQKRLGISVDSLSDIENRRFTDIWINKNEVKPFFAYSVCYKNLLVV